MAVYDAKKVSIWYAKNHTVAMMHSELKMEKYCNFFFVISYKHNLLINKYRL